MTLHRDVSDALWTPELKAARQVEEWLRLLVREVATEAAVVMRHDKDLLHVVMGTVLPPAVVAEMVRERRDAEVHDLVCRIVERVREARTPPRRGEEAVSWPL